jgi:LysR family transcriptional activator of glutamate synthase operon
MDGVGFNELRMFLEFARTEHLGRAAEALEMSVPSIQRSVRALEVRLGVPLVEREGRRIRLLHAGRVLAEEAARVLRVRTEAIETVQRAGGRHRMRLRVGHTNSLGLEVVPWLVADLLRREPATRVSLTNGHNTTLLGRLLAHELDAVLISVTPSEPDVELVPVFDEGLRFACAVDDPLASSTAIDLATVRDRPFVVLFDASGTRHYMMQACARAGFTPRVAIEVADIFTVEGIVGAGIAVSVVPERMGDHVHPRIARIPLIESVPTRRTVHLAFLRHDRDHRPLAAFAESARAFAHREGRQTLRPA